MALFQQFRSLFQLPGALKQSSEAQSQDVRLRNLLAQRQASLGKLPVSPQGPALAPSPSPTQTGEVNPQIQAIQGALGGLKGQAEQIQSGLQNIQQRQSSPSAEERLRPFREKVSGLFGPSAEEEGLRQKLANLMSAREKGLIAAEEEAVPLQAILGSQQKIERRALAGAIPLQEQLSQLMARREGERKAAEFGFGAERDILKEEREERKPVELALGAALFDPATGKQIFKAPERERAVSASERTRVLQTEAIGVARPLLIAARGADGYVDANTYLKLRNDYAESIGNPSDFDRTFGPMLSPEERQRLGVGRVITTDQDIGDILAQYLGGQ